MPIYSHSRLSTYEQCPLKYKFSYIDKIETEAEQSIEAFLGSMVHDVLEWLYKNVKMTKIPSLKECIDYYEEQWKKNYTKDIVINSKFTASHYFNLGKNFITKYYQGYAPFEENTIAMEKRVLIDLDGSGKYKLQGYIDRLVYDDEENVYEIHDYKTNKALKEQMELEEDRQLALYSIAVKAMYPDAHKIGLVWHFLAFDKEFCIYKTDEQLENLKKKTIKVIQEIESAKEFKPNPSKLCYWCEFQSLCPQFKHLAEVQEKSANKFLKEEGVKLVNRYAELTKQKREIVDKIEKEMEQLKEAIVQYAKKKGVDVIFGSNNKLAIKFSENLKLPGKNTKEREELDNLIKKLDKWDEVSTLDTFALTHILEDKEWPDEILKKIEKFGEMEESVRLSLSKREEGEE
ncbi:MAG: PD-(D/E)XK nuclease family protein [archaeon]